MTSVPAFRSVVTRSIVGAVCVCTVLVTALVAIVAIGTPAGAQQSPRFTAQGDEPMSDLTLVGRSPWVGAEDELVLDVRTGGDTTDTVLRIEIHEPVDSAAELERSLGEDVGRVLYRSPRIPVGFVPVRPDGALRLVVQTSAGGGDALTARLRTPGVHPVVVSLTGPDGTVATVRTPVVRLGTEDDPLPAPALALLVEFAVPPTVTPEARREVSDDELARLDDLATVLVGAVGDDDTRPRLSATVAARPDTLDALAATADPRSIRVLESLAASSRDGTVVASPYVPLDVPGLLDVDLGDFVEPIVATGVSVLRDRLADDVDASLWDAPDGIDRAGAALLPGLGFNHLLIDGPERGSGDGNDDGSDPAERGLVDAGPVAVGGVDTLDAYLVDTTTSKILESSADDRVDAGHVALAGLILRDDGAASDVVVRIDEAPTDSVLRHLLPLLTMADAPVTIGPVTAARITGDDADDDRAGVLEAAPPEGSPLTADFARRVRAATEGIDTFDSFVDTESARADALRLRIATSIAVGVDAAERTSLVDSVETAVSTAFDAVALAGPTDLNLTSRNGTLPLMIRNDNDFPVRVVLRIRSDRLTFPEGDRFEYTLTEDVTRIDIPVEARATGSVPTAVELRTPDEEVVLDSRQLNVRSTAISGVGLALSLGALAVLILWWARTWRRSRTPETAHGESSRRPGRVG